MGFDPIKYVPSTGGYDGGGAATVTEAGIARGKLPRSGYRDRCGDVDVDIALPCSVHSVSNLSCLDFGNQSTVISVTCQIYMAEVRR